MNVINRVRSRQAGRTVLSGMLALVFCYVMMFMELPYYIFQPGTAESIREMVKVGADGGDPESGTVLLTTVGVTGANMLRLMEAQLRSYDVRKISEVRAEGESDEEYGERQHQIMLTSQSSAIQAAYRRAGIPYRIETTGISVIRVEAGSPADGVLTAGDRLTGLDGRAVKSGEEMAGALAAKKAGDTVRLAYLRNSAAQEAQLTLRELAPKNGVKEPRIGIGVTTADLQVVRTDEESRTVAIEAGEIGGPSAGFVFALEIYGRLTPGDLTKGYKIAGTGTIDIEGRIGVIGGIRHKVVAADREGADLFFAPKDYQDPAGGAPVINASEAAEQARKIGSKMKVVPVGTLEEAVQYLEKLPPKAAAE